MRIGGPIFKKYTDAGEWIAAVKDAGYNAAYCPLDTDADENQIAEYRKAANKNDIIIAEVGAWSNPISKHSEKRKKGMIKCKEGLKLADEIGALCCVNISGSQNPDGWDFPSIENLTPDTFALIVDCIREIIDEVNPKNTYYTLETMPFMYPDSADSYLELIKAIDRKQFAVHFDPVNMINSPERYYNNGKVIKEFFKKLGPYIKSTHAKDIILQNRLTVHLDEVRPGLGGLDYQVFLKEIKKLGSNIPIMVEHLPDENEYIEAVKHIKKQAEIAGVI